MKFPQKQEIASPFFYPEGGLLVPAFTKQPLAA
jgi:hypothetical protein